MIKCLLSGLLLTSVFFAQAQTKNDSLSTSLQGNNEIKLNVLYTVLGSPELTYERILSDHTAIGISAFIRLTTIVKMDFKSGINPYFRYYFGSRKASGFFLEGHGALLAFDGASVDKPDYYIDSFGNSVFFQPIKETYYGFGAAAGGKFLTRKGFTFDIYLGGSQTFAKSGNYFLPRGGLTLGKRF